MAKTVALHVRVPARVVEKMDWLAAEQGTTRPDIIRNALYQVSKDAKPPKECGIIRVPADKLDRWAQAAAKTKYKTIEQLLDGLADRIQV